METLYHKSLILPPNYPRPGEDTLVSSDIFSENSLSMYCDVPACDVTLQRGSAPRAAPLDKERLDYLICKGDTAIMAIDAGACIDRHGRLSDVDGLCFFETSEMHMMRGDVCDILEKLRELLAEPKPSNWICNMTDYPAKHKKRLLDELLLERLPDCEPPLDLVPSVYGLDMGITKAYRSSRGHIRCMPMCSPRVIERLEEILNPAAYAVAECRQIPFAERIQSMKSGLPGNSIHSVNAVREIMDTPLDAYMLGYRGIHKMLSNATAARTYGECAQKIHTVLQRDSTGDAAELVRLLTAPLGDASAETVDADTADEMPQDSHRSPVGTERSLDKRIERLKQPPNPRVAAIGKFANITLESFCQGVSLLTRMYYPIWPAERIKTIHDLPDGFSYGDLIAYGNSEAVDEEGDLTPDGGELLYRLAVEPFGLIHKKSKTKKQTKELS